MSLSFEGAYSPEIIQAYDEVRQFVDIPIDLFVKELWNKGHQAHVETPLKTSQTQPYAGAPNALEEHRKAMERLAISKVSQLLADKTHEECKDVFRNQEFVHSSIVSVVHKMPGCRDPIAFLKTQEISKPEQHHLDACSEITESIMAIWDGYKQKRLKSHNAIKFRKYFTKNMLKSDELVAEKKQRKSQSVESPIPGIRSTAGDAALPGLRLKTAFTEDIYADMPALRTKSFGGEGTTNQAVEDIFADMPALGTIIPDADVSSLAASTSSLGFDDDDDGPPPLRVRANFQKVGSPTPLASSTDNVRQPLASDSVSAAETPVENTDDLIAVGWMEKYIQRNKKHLPLKNYIYFSPTNECAQRVLRTVEVNKEVQFKKKPFNPDKFVSTHLCPDFQPEKDIGNKSFNPLMESPTGDYLILVNRDSKIQLPSVRNPSLQNKGVLDVYGVKVRVFVHDNIFHFTE